MYFPQFSWNLYSFALLPPHEWIEIFFRPDARREESEDNDEKFSISSILLWGLSFMVNREQFLWQLLKASRGRVESLAKHRTSMTDEAERL